MYDLNPLCQKGFDFVYDASSGIQHVAVKKLRLSSKVKKGDRITLEADTTNRPDAVYELLAQIGKSIPLQLYNVTQVELTTSVVVDANKPPKAVTDPHYASQLLFAQVRRVGPEVARHVECLRD